MLINGLIKALIRKKFKIFKAQLGLIQDNKRLKERKLRVISNDKLEAKKDKIPGNKVSI